MWYKNNQPTKKKKKISMSVFSSYQKAFTNIPKKRLFTLKCNKKFVVYQVKSGVYVNACATINDDFFRHMLVYVYIYIYILNQ